MGSVHKYQLQSGATRYVVSYRDPFHKQVMKRGFARKIDAQQSLRTVEVSKDGGAYVDPADALATIGKLRETWLQNRKAVLKPSACRSLDSA